MKLEFEAKKVEYNEAMDGEIIQVIFDTEMNHDSVDDDSISLIIGANYEFPPFKATVDWYDGKEYDGGIEIKSYTLSDNKLILTLQNNMNFVVSFTTDDITFKKIKNFLSDDSKQSSTV